MKKVVMGLMCSLIMLTTGTAFAVDDATVQAIDEKAANANAKADGNNSRIQALEEKDIIEEAARITADADLQNQINTEATTRAAADADLQDQIDNIQLIEGPQGPEGPQGIQGEVGPPGPVRFGKKVSGTEYDNLYEVHVRKIWSAGWHRNDDTMPGRYTTEQGVNYLRYGLQDTDWIYSPLEGYGEPPLTPGATRMVRLYVTYGNGIYDGYTHLRFQSKDTGDYVEFELPRIWGEPAYAGAVWSEFKSFNEYSGLGHCSVDVFLTYAGPWVGWGQIFDVEVHYYDAY